MEPTIKRKGQWLMAGGFLILAIVSALVLTKTTLDLDSFERSEENAIFESISNEFDDLLLIAINETSNLTERTVTFKDYLSFTENYGIGRGVEVNQLFILALPTSSGVELVAINYYNQPIDDFSITLNGLTGVVTDIPHGGHQIYSFPDTSSRYNITYRGDVTDSDNEAFRLEETYLFDRRVFGILELELQAKDYIRREIVVR